MTINARMMVPTRLMKISTRCSGAVGIEVAGPLSKVTCGVALNASPPLATPKLLKAALGAHPRELPVAAKSQVWLPCR